jgi:hypothetical protein
MSAALARSNQGLQNRMSQVGPWPTFPSWFDCDPFHYLRASYNFEYDVTRTQEATNLRCRCPVTRLIRSKSL